MLVFAALIPVKVYPAVAVNVNDTVYLVLFANVVGFGDQDIFPLVKFPVAVYELLVTGGAPATGIGTFVIAIDAIGAVFIVMVATLLARVAVPFRPVLVTRT